MRNHPSRELLRKYTSEAFGLHFVIDLTGMPNYRIRMSRRPPRDLSEELGSHPEAVRFQHDAQLITELGDGVQAFVGLLTALLSLPHKVVLVDEPEAFLHPPLARRLGTNLSELARQRGASLVVATHSPSFVMGCLESSAEVTVVRLTFDAGVATARMLSATDLAALMRDPFVRSTNVLSGLFHGAVVVTEGDPDRAFYDEVNRRLVAVGRGIQDVLFIGATGGVGAVHKVVAPLRRLGIPAVALVDLDAIKQKGTWTALLRACRVPPNEIANLEGDRASLDAACPDSGTLKRKGLRAF